MLKGALIGIGITLVGMLPPILHFVTGPLGPFIGGFVGGSSVRATPEKALGIGTLMGLFGILPALVFLATLTLVFDFMSLDNIGVPLILGWVLWLGLAPWAPLEPCLEAMSLDAPVRGARDRRRPAKGSST